MSRLVRLIRLEVQPPVLDSFLDRQRTNVAGSRAEPGCVQFRIGRSPEEERPGGPAIFYLWEEFRDPAALEAHFASPHFQAWKHWLDSLPDGTVTRRALEMRPAWPED